MYIKVLNLFVLLHRAVFSILNTKNRDFYIDIALSIVKTTNCHQILKIRNPWEYYVWKHPKKAIVQNRENCFSLQSYCNKTLKICCPSYHGVTSTQECSIEKDGFCHNTRKWAFYSTSFSIKTHILIINKLSKLAF
jgi:hypothetical protein